MADPEVIIGMDFGAEPSSTAVAVLKRGKVVAYAPPPGAGRIVDIVDHHGKLIVACEYGVYRLDGDQFVAIEWAWE